jgi:hypothetical protein
MSGTREPNATIRDFSDNQHSSDINNILPKMVTTTAPLRAPRQPMTCRQDENQAETLGWQESSSGPGCWRPH